MFQTVAALLAEVYIASRTLTLAATTVVWRLAGGGTPTMTSTYSATGRPRRRRRWCSPVDRRTAAAARLLPGDRRHCRNRRHVAGTSQGPQALSYDHFCGQGEAKDFVADDAIEIGGRLPINTHGGQLSEAYIHGMNGIAEGVRQRRGTSVNQVDKVEHVLVTAGTSVPTSGLILG
jgi:hypothetical protein